MSITSVPQRCCNCRYVPGSAAGVGRPLSVTRVFFDQCGIRRLMGNTAGLDDSTRRRTLGCCGYFVSCEIVTWCVEVRSVVKVEGPYQLMMSPLPERISPQSLIIPNPRAPLTEQQFSSGLPARAWNTMSCALALRVPSIGVL